MAGATRSESPIPSLPTRKACSVQGALRTPRVAQEKGRVRGEAKDQGLPDAGAPGPQPWGNELPVQRKTYEPTPDTHGRKPTSPREAAASGRPVGTWAGQGCSQGQGSRTSGLQELTHVATAQGLAQVTALGKDLAHEAGGSLT